MLTPKMENDGSWQSVSRMAGEAAALLWGRNRSLSANTRRCPEKPDRIRGFTRGQSRVFRCPETHPCRSELRCRHFTNPLLPAKQAFQTSPHRQISEPSLDHPTPHRRCNSDALPALSGLRRRTRLPRSGGTALEFPGHQLLVPQQPATRGSAVRPGKRRDRHSSSCIRSHKGRSCSLRNPAEKHSAGSTAG